MMMRITTIKQIETLLPVLRLLLLGLGLSVSFVEAFSTDWGSCRRSSNSNNKCYPCIHHHDYYDQQQSRFVQQQQYDYYFRLSWMPTITCTASSRCCRCRMEMVGDAKGEYYGESAGSYMVQEFNTFDQLMEIVKMASLPLPERPDGIVTIVKYTTTKDDNCRTTESEYERMARNHPSSLFLRCFAEYEDSEIVFGQANVVVKPTFDIYYGNNRVARIEGTNHIEVEEIVKKYEFQNTSLDLFSEISAEPWGSPSRKIDYSKTPRTTNRFVPGYDWGSDRGFFDATADKMEQDMMGMYENSWLPKTDDEKSY